MLENITEDAMLWKMCERSFHFPLCLFPEDSYLIRYACMYSLYAYLKVVIHIDNIMYNHKG
jgi:hypothetical protein